LVAEIRKIQPTEIGGLRPPPTRIGVDGGFQISPRGEIWCNLTTATPRRSQRNRRHKPKFFTGSIRCESTYCLADGSSKRFPVASSKKSGTCFKFHLQGWGVSGNP
jgi:hypothetical protein